MGNCNSLPEGEEYVRKVLLNVGLWKVKFEDIYKELTNSSDNNLIDITAIKEHKIGKYFEHSLKYSIQHEFVLDAIFKTLDTNNTGVCSLFLLLFYLLSFLGKSYDIPTSKHFYWLILKISNKNENDSLTINELKHYLNMFYVFNLKIITQSIQQSIANLNETNERKWQIRYNGISSLINSVYNEINIKKELSWFFNHFNKANEEYIPIDEFVDLSKKKYLFFSHVKMREYYMINYGNS